MRELMNVGLEKDRVLLLEEELSILLFWDLILVVGGGWGHLNSLGLWIVWHKGEHKLMVVWHLIKYCDMNSIKVSFLLRLNGILEVASCFETAILKSGF